MSRVYQLCPQITHGKGPESFKIISHNVGFRPARRDGIRIEKETKCKAKKIVIFLSMLTVSFNLLLVYSDGRKVIVCHNYGHGSHGKYISTYTHIKLNLIVTGYQSSWGSSQRVVKLLKDERISKL